MSSLTSRSEMFWRPVLYNSKDERIAEGCEHRTRLEASDDAKDMIARYIDKHHSYCHAKLECIIRPIYE